MIFELRGADTMVVEFFEVVDRLEFLAFLGVDVDCFAIDIKAPFCVRPEFRRQSEKHQDMIHSNFDRFTIFWLNRD